jgi:hypothetical protein
MDSMQGCEARSAEGNQGKRFGLSEGVKIVVVEDLKELVPALDELKASMQVGLDLRFSWCAHLTFKRSIK